MIRRLVVLGLALVAVGIVRFTERPTPALSITALDVGQGDSVLIRTPSGFDILVDTGPDRRALDVLGRYLPPGDRTIELLVLTHPHADHIGGVLPILDHYRVAQVWDPGVRSDTALARAVDRSLSALNVPVHTVLSGTSVDPESGVRIEVLSPQESTVEKNSKGTEAQKGGLNDASVVLRVTYRGFCALLMGDASDAVEADLVARGRATPCPVLKVGHHGSRFSSSTPFLTAVRPEVALIGVGRNGYGHPAPAALRRLETAGATVLRTDQYGSITLRYDDSLHIRTSRR